LRPSRIRASSSSRPGVGAFRTAYHALYYRASSTAPQVVTIRLTANDLPCAESLLMLESAARCRYGRALLWTLLGAALAGAFSSPPLGGDDAATAPQGRGASRPIQRRAVPAPSNGAWARNPIDRFVLRGLEAEGLTPAPPARRQALLRRAHFDL